MLLFKKKFLDAVLNGTKTQTVRLWKHRLMRSGQRSYTPGIGPIRILQVEAVEIDQLSDADALPDGFPDAKSLKRELRDIYADKLAAGYQAYRVTFAVGDGSEE